MAAEVIGYVKCHECGYESAEVKETKRVFQSKPLVMVWCPHPQCLSQHFPRSHEASNRIRNRMRPADSESEAPPASNQADEKKTGGLSAIFG